MCGDGDDDRRGLGLMTRRPWSSERATRWGRPAAAPPRSDWRSGPARRAQDTAAPGSPALRAALALDLRQTNTDRQPVGSCCTGSPSYGIQVGARSPDDPVRSTGNLTRGAGHAVGGPRWLVGDPSDGGGFMGNGPSPRGGAREIPYGANAGTCPTVTAAGREGAALRLARCATRRDPGELAGPGGARL